MDKTLERDLRFATEELDSEHEIQKSLLANFVIDQGIFEQLDQESYCFLFFLGPRFPMMILVVSLQSSKELC